MRIRIRILPSSASFLISFLISSVSANGVSMAANLTTDAYLLAALPSFASVASADRAALISAASQWATDHVGGVLAQDSFDEEHTPGFTRLLTLNNRPVVSVLRVQADLSVGLSIKYSGAAQRATVNLDTTGDALALVPSAVELRSTLSGVIQTPAVIALSTAPTLQTVCDQVNIHAGWSCAVAPTLAGLPSADLRPIQGALSAVIAPINLQIFASELPDFELRAETGEMLLYTLRAEPYRYPDRTWGIDPRSSLVRVNYTAGWANVPDKFQRACVILVKDLYDATRNTGVYFSETLGARTYTLAAATRPFPSRASELLCNVRRDRDFS
jgi:hypothetical protein